MEKNVIRDIRRELKSRADKQYKKGNKRFFKEKYIDYGVRTPIVRSLAKKYFKKIEGSSKKYIFSLSEELLKSNYNEEATVAIQWSANFKNEFEKKDFAVFERWLKKYIKNWGKTDDFCLHLIHPLIEQYPELIKNIKSWTHSSNRWLRRASAVSFINTSGQFYTTKHNLEDIFEVAKILLKDKDDLVQKGYGWMLKSASVYNQREVFNFVMKNKKEMPRTALRYAIEKMPKKLKKQAMKK